MTEDENKVKFYQKPYLKNVFILLLLLVFAIIFSVIAEGFFSRNNLVNIIRISIYPILTGLAATVLMTAGYIDLSVGSILAVSSIIFSILVKANVPIFPSLIVAVLAGTTCGFINSLAVVRLKITPVIATLGSAYLIRGITFIIAGDQANIRGLPESFAFLGRGFVGPIPFQLILTVVFVLIFYFIERKSLLWKYSIAIGGNPSAAMLSGINVAGIISILYVLTGTLAGLSGAIMASRLTVGQKLIGYGFELDVIIAVLLGGTSFRGGEGSIIGTLIGALILTILSVGFNMAGMPSFYQYVIKGVLLILAVLMDNFVKARIRKIG